MAIVVWLIVAEALYVRALRMLGRPRRRVPRGQVVLLAPRARRCRRSRCSRRSGSLADELLSAHMAEHLLLADLGAPLLLAGLRNPVLAFFLPRAVLVPLARARRLRAAFRCAAPAARRDPGLRARALRLALLVRVRGAPCATTSCTSLQHASFVFAGDARVVVGARAQAPAAARRAVEDRPHPRRADDRDVPRDGASC